MKHFFLSLNLLFSLFTTANEPYKIEIPSNLKVVSTFSGSVNNDSSIHLIILETKNGDNHILLPIYVSKNKEFKELETIQLNYLPSIISHHSNGKIITLLGFNKKKNLLSIIDIDTENESNTTTNIENFDSPDNTFRLDDKTIFVNKGKLGRKLSIHNFVFGTQKTNDTITYLEGESRGFKLFIKEVSEAINRNEFVETGSIKKRKVYYSDNSLIFTLDDGMNNSTRSMTIHLDNNNEISYSFFKTFEDFNVKDYNSFLYENNIFSISSNKKDLVLKIFDMESEKEIKRFSLIDNLKTVYPDSEVFLKNAAKGKMRPTLTLNKTEDDAILIIIDQVDINTYNYHYNWWFHNWIMQQQMMQMQMQQQQMMMNTMPTGFSPNVEAFNEFYDIYSPPKDIEPISFVLSKEFDLLENASQETVFKNIDKSAMLEPFEDDRNYEKFTASFNDTEMHYIYQDRKTKEVFINIKPID